MTLKLTTIIISFSNMHASQKNSQLYTVFPQIEARASISYPGLLVEQIQDKNNKNQTNWDSNPSSEGSKIITLTKRAI